MTANNRCEHNNLMSKVSQKGSVLLILVLIFIAVVITGAVIVYKTMTNSTKKLSKTSQELTLVLKSEYNNPFDKKTQYENPFNESHNPFDDLK